MESVHVGLVAISWSVHELVQVYQVGTPSVPSHASLGEVDDHGTIDQYALIPLLPSQSGVHQAHVLFALSWIPSQHFATKYLAQEKRSTGVAPLLRFLLKYVAGFWL